MKDACTWRKDLPFAFPLNFKNVCQALHRQKTNEILTEIVLIL